VFGRFDCHTAGLNEKPEQLKAALVLESAFCCFRQLIESRLRLRLAEELAAWTHLE
jgi:hypothetical protein